MTRVTIWNEYRHELESEDVARVYPKGIHAAISDGLSKNGDFEIRTATLDEPEHGLTNEVLSTTDVLFWWGHKAHAEVQDEIVTRVHRRVLEGMGLVVLHSGHFSKIFKAVLGTHCSLKWREAGERERIWVIEPSHPIAAGLPECIELEHCEMYGERFDIPQPDQVVFISWFQGGEVFRSGCTFQRGHGRIFYFRPGHETFPIFYNEQIRLVLANAARWAAPRMTQANIPVAPRVEPREPLPQYEGRLSEGKRGHH